MSLLRPEGIPESLLPVVQRHLNSIESAAGESLNQCIAAHPEPENFLSALNRVVSASDFVADQLRSDPGLLFSLAQDAESPIDLAGFREACMDCQTDQELDSLLRKNRQQAMVKILWQDFNQSDPTVRYRNTVAQVSALAEASIQVAMDFHYKTLCDRFGTPIGKLSGEKQSMVVLGMGKLGAAELNVSSDIDLIFTYPESGETRHLPADNEVSDSGCEGVALSNKSLALSNKSESSHAKKQIPKQKQSSKTLSNQEFFVRLGQRIIKSLDVRSAEGFVFRVDMRLRPYGQSGALVLNFDAMEDYYQTQGRDWERFAMIKARPVAGPEQSADEIMALLQPFTYRQYLDFSAIDALRSTKALINREVQRKGINTDVKLGFGGIREIEFIVQAFQLIRGGRDVRLRDPRVEYLLPLLEAEGFLPEEAAKKLWAAYILLRNTEHAVQGYQDQQTQALPCDAIGEDRLAWIMGYGSWDLFNDELKSARVVVNEEFQSVVAAPEDTQSEVDALKADWQALWFGDLSLEDCEALLPDVPAPSLDQIVVLLKSLRESRAVLAMQASARDRLDRFVPHLLMVLSQESFELPYSEALARILNLVESVVRRSAYLVLLLENPDALRQLVRLSAASPWIAEELAKHPALLDELLDARTLYTPPDKQGLRDELRQAVLCLHWEDLEGHMEVLRHFRQAHGLRVAASEVTDILPLMKVSDYLSDIAEVIIEHVLNLAWENMVARHGTPRRDDGSLCDPDFIVVAYGKLGGIELAHGSDLDLVFIHDASSKQSTDGERNLDNQTFYTRLGQRIIHIITTRMTSGELYEVDMRLRPSGNSGLLVSSLTAFEKYQMEEAWVWEHQALVRARVVAGCPKLAARFNRVREKVLGQSRDLLPLREEVIKMREKMRQHLGSKGSDDEKFHLKQDAGGIVDIEFMVQYAVLAWAKSEPSLMRYTDNIRILGCLETLQRLDPTEVHRLIDAYKAYRSAGHRLALQRQSTTLDGSLFIPEREAVTQLWQRLLSPTQ